MNTGVMITLCGAGGTVIAYCIAGVIVTCVMLCLSEMVSFRHSAGVIFDFPSKFVSPALGFTVGIIYWYVWNCLSICESALTLLRLSYAASIVTLTAAATDLLEWSVGPDEIGKSTYSKTGITESAVTMIIMIFIIFISNVVGGVQVSYILVEKDR